jgi:hypothetical protein
MRKRIFAVECIHIGDYDMYREFRFQEKIIMEDGVDMCLLWMSTLYRKHIDSGLIRVRFRE